MARNIVVSASPGYEMGLQALLNSYSFWHGKDDVCWHLLLYKDVKVKMPETFRKRAVIHALPTDIGNAMACKIHRFKYGAELSGAVIILDADMFFCNNIDWWWSIIEAGWILYGSNGSNVEYTEAHSQKYGLPLTGKFNHKTVTSVPAGMLTGEYGKLWQAIFDHRTDPDMPRQGADFELVNAYLVHMGLLDKVVALSPAQVTNIHHYQMKPNTKVMRRNDSPLYTEDGLEVCMSHGRWFNHGYVENLMVPMRKYCGNIQKCVIGAENARTILLDEFKCALNNKYAERYPWRPVKD